MKKYYYRFTPKIFPDLRFKSVRQLSPGSLYDPKPLEDSLQKSFGDAKVKDSLTSLMISATNLRDFRPVWIRSIKGVKDDSPENWSSMLMREATRASASAPIYFPACYAHTTPDDTMPHVTQKHPLIDGQFTGNMARRAYTQAKKIAPPDAEIVVIHLDTGNTENRFTAEEWNKLGALGMLSKSQGSPLLSLVFNVSAFDTMEDLKDEIGDRLLSFDCVLDIAKDPQSPSRSLDDASDENLRRLEKAGERVIKENSTEFERVCTILTQRTFAEERHQASRTAFQKIADLLSEQNTIKSFTQLYQKILRYTTDLDDKPEPGDENLIAACKDINEGHKEDLDRFYSAQLDRKKAGSQTLDKIRTAADDFTDVAKKIFVDPFKPKDPPPPANDDNQQPDQVKKPKTPKM
jgi:predicted acylesterase/phospholipase RssA